MFYFSKVKVFTLSFLSLITEVLYNLGHNILRIFDILPKFAFVTSEIECDY